MMYFLKTLASIASEFFVRLAVAILALVILVGGAAFLFQAALGEDDACLDWGGRWNYEARVCEHE